MGVEFGGVAYAQPLPRRPEVQRSPSTPCNSHHPFPSPLPITSFQFLGPGAQKSLSAGSFHVSEGECDAGWPEVAVSY